MAAGSMMDRDISTAVRYETLIRISNSIRDRKGPQELFELLVQELGKVIRFDAIAQFDESANKVNWHLGPGCQQHEDCAAALVLSTAGAAEEQRRKTVGYCPCHLRSCRPSAA